MFKNHKKILEHELGSLRILPEWTGKCVIQEYTKSGWEYIRDYCKHYSTIIYFDTKEEAEARIIHMNKQDLLIGKK